MKIGSRVFSRRTRDEIGDKGTLGPQRHHSLAIRESQRHLLGAGHKVEILDLGAASGETLAYYTGLPCKIFFADFFAELKTLDTDPEDPSSDGFAKACRRLLAFSSSTRFDLIHSWDLFNYLSLEEIGGLADYLRRFSGEVAPLVSLIWTKRRIPAQPNRYAIIDSETVEYRRRSGGQRPGPLYKEPDLLKAMSGYRAAKSFLLRHGVQEYVFEPRVGVDLSPRGLWES